MQLQNLGKNFQSLAPPRKSIAYVLGDYVYAISRSNPPKIYSLADNTWQQGKANSNSFEHEGLDTAAAVMNSKLLLCMGFMNVLMIFTSSIIK